MSKNKKPEIVTTSESFKELQEFFGDLVDEDIVRVPLGAPEEGNSFDVQIVSDKSAEECDMVVCVRKKDNKSPFKDNVDANCAHCGEEITHRPHVPKKPPKICMECAVVMMEAEKKGFN
jgi:hypothetical protein